jgi:SAM-dependent methyltransferase
MSDAEFDRFATDYREVLDRSLAVSGEDSAYFARGRVSWLSRVLGPGAREVRALVDYGCGPGNVTPFLLETFPGAHLTGVDVSEKSVAEANARHGSDRARFEVLSAASPGPGADLVHCNGVFHHIPIAERPAALAWVRAALKPGGWFALFENNAWNPVVRWAMDRCPFDTDAIPIGPAAAVRLVRAAGFEVRGVDHLFFFPRALGALRRFEPWLRGVPMGGQYLVLARRPVE